MQIKCYLPMKLLDFEVRLFIYLFIYLFSFSVSESTIKCIIGLGRFARILKDQWKW